MTDRPASSPLTSTLVVIGLGTVLVAAVGAIAGALSDDFAATFGRVGTVGMVVVAILGVLVAVRPSLVPTRRPR
ncbi:hypothetical protein JL107_17055 [Nakamurella flavida]|uniref:Uncharacterized protein n=1 Tax=Nakamurella flavida TaxID=363630 RepID=A0A938YRK3_9ACTN|nr:hypothetical protein [Nakamurella flavida]MBM9478159.1 hypothetical protein [Nakamurella flavida]MDP9778619.1 preprotein translocase subunit Sss1 [Nakamurella flavida]